MAHLGTAAYCAALGQLLDQLEAEPNPPQAPCSAPAAAAGGGLEAIAFIVPTSPPIPQAQGALHAAARAQLPAPCVRSPRCAGSLSRHPGSSSCAKDSNKCQPLWSQVPYTVVSEQCDEAADGEPTAVSAAVASTALNGGGGGVLTGAQPVSSVGAKRAASGSPPADVGDWLEVLLSAAATPEGGAATAAAPGGAADRIAAAAFVSSRPAAIAACGGGGASDGASGPWVAKDATEWRGTASAATQSDVLVSMWVDGDGDETAHTSAATAPLPRAATALDAHEVLGAVATGGGADSGHWARRVAPRHSNTQLLNLLGLPRLRHQPLRPGESAPYAGAVEPYDHADSGRAGTASSACSGGPSSLGTAVRVVEVERVAAGPGRLPAVPSDERHSRLPVAAGGGFAAEWPALPAEPSVGAAVCRRAIAMPAVGLSGPSTAACRRARPAAVCMSSFVAVEGPGLARGPYAAGDGPVEVPGARRYRQHATVVGLAAAPALGESLGPCYTPLSEGAAGIVAAAAEAPAVSQARSELRGAWRHRGRRGLGLGRPARLASGTTAAADAKIEVVRLDLDFHNPRTGADGMPYPVEWTGDSFAWDSDDASGGAGGSGEAAGGDALDLSSGYDMYQLLYDPDEDDYGKLYGAYGGKMYGALEGTATCVRAGPAQATPDLGGGAACGGSWGQRNGALRAGPSDAAGSNLAGCWHSPRRCPASQRTPRCDPAAASHVDSLWSAL